MRRRCSGSLIGSSPSIITSFSDLRFNPGFLSTAMSAILDEGQVRIAKIAGHLMCREAFLAFNLE